MASMQGLGYKEILLRLDGEYPLAEAIRILKRDMQYFCKAPADLVQKRTDDLAGIKKHFTGMRVEILELHEYTQNEYS